MGSFVRCTRGGRFLSSLPKWQISSEIIVGKPSLRLIFRCRLGASLSESITGTAVDKIFKLGLESSRSQFGSASTDRLKLVRNPPTRPSGVTGLPASGCGDLQRGWNWQHGCTGTWCRGPLCDDGCDGHGPLHPLPVPMHCSGRLREDPGGRWNLAKGNSMNLKHKQAWAGGGRRSFHFYGTFIPATTSGSLGRAGTAQGGSLVQGSSCLAP